MESSFIGDVALFCKNNGFDFVTLVTNTNAGSHFLEVSKSLSSMDIKSRTLTLTEAEEQLVFGLDSLILDIDFDQAIKDSEDLLNRLSLVSILHPKKSLMLVRNPLTDNDILKLFSLIDLFPHNGLFYIGHPSRKNKSKTMFKQVITLIKTYRAITSDVAFDKFGHVKETYHLQGTKLTCITLPWAPMMIMDHCNAETGFDCQISGLLPVHMDAMCNMLNCSWDCQHEPDGNWGVSPVSGPFNRSGVWNGVMGGIVNNDVMMSVAPWYSSLNRYGLLDFVNVGYTRHYLAFTPSKPTIDFNLFLRPFKTSSWMVIGFVLTTALLCHFLPYAYIEYFEDTSGYLMATTASWTFFLLVNAYYCGAMTMFFAVDQGTSFSTMDQVLEAYPGWKLIVRKANAIFFQQQILQGNQLYIDLWDRVENKPEETLWATVEEGLAKIKDGNAAMHIDSNVIHGFFKTNQFFQQDIKLFAGSKPRGFGIVVNQKSPLKPIFQSASNIIYETGLYEDMQKEWIGDTLPIFRQSPKVILSLGQTILIYIVISGSVTVSFLVFCFETLYTHRFYPICRK